MKRRIKLEESWWRKFTLDVKFCFRCGGILQKKFVRAENRRRLVCADCGQITYLNPKVVAGMVPLTRSGKVVLLKRKIAPGKGKWTYPAGFLEMGESVAAGARRETREEIGARVKLNKLVGIYSYKKLGVVTVVYDGKILSGERPRKGNEAEEVRAFPIGKIPWKKLAFRSTVQALSEWEIMRGKY